MKLINRGKIFDPTEHTLPAMCEQYAQSPQALVAEDRVRVYFSTRARDGNGKFLSHVAYVDFDSMLEKVISVADRQVISLGELGAFDEHGIFPFNVAPVGNELFAYTSGWSRRVSVSVETGIGIAKSKDGGKTFSRLGPGPVLTASLDEPFLVGDPFVKNFNNSFYMWYIFGTEWREYDENGPPERIYKIGYAMSEDGIAWERANTSQLIADSLGSDESQALPSVIFCKDQYHMFFCFRESYDFRSQADRGYRLGYARSDDLVSWQRHDTLLEAAMSYSDWDNEMQCYPNVFETDGRVFLLYNGNEFGKYGFGLAEIIFD
jgi:predicted GH43/DUF377 family glycosyl hydrolase